MYSSADNRESSFNQGVFYSSVHQVHISRYSTCYCSQAFMLKCCVFKYCLQLGSFKLGHLYAHKTVIVTNIVDIVVLLNVENKSVIFIYLVILMEVSKVPYLFWVQTIVL